MLIEIFDLSALEIKTAKKFISANVIVWLISHMESNQYTYSSLA